MRTFPLLDGDGFHAYRKDGTERMMTAFVLHGDSYDPKND